MKVESLERLTHPRLVSAPHTWISCLKMSAKKFISTKIQFYELQISPKKTNKNCSDVKVWSQDLSSGFNTNSSPVTYFTHRYGAVFFVSLTWGLACG